MYWQGQERYVARVRQVQGLEAELLGGNRNAAMAERQIALRDADACIRLAGSLRGETVK